MPKRARLARPADTRPKNRLLACLPRVEYQRIRSRLRTVQTLPKQVFQRVNEPIREVFFLNGGVASITAVMSNGATVEIATVGDEGVIGVHAMFGPGATGGETMMQVPDTDAESMSAEDFRQELARGGPFRDCIQRYSGALILLMMQSTACMALHTVQERFCRWLLMTHDRIHRDDFQLSHEFLAMMLGSTRPTVTIVAGALQKRGLIKYTHGHITILDREGLEAASCECYGTVRAHFDRLDL